MTTLYVQDGYVLDYPNSGSSIAVGTPTLMGNIIGIPLVTIANGATGPMAVYGIFTCPKVTGTAWTQGAKLSWDVSVSKFDLGTAVPATGDLTGCCVAAAAAASGDATGKVLLNVAVGTITPAPG